MGRHKIVGQALACFFIAAVSCEPGAAQDTALGSRVVKHAEVTSEYSKAEALTGAHDMAECLVHRRRDAAINYLDATSAQRALILVKPLDKEERCLGAAKTEYEDSVRLIAPPAIFRGLLAEELLRQVYSRATVAAQPLQRVYHSAWSDFDGREAPLDDMAVCVAATDPIRIQSLVATPPSSPAEDQAMRDLTPALGRCLQANTQLRGNRQSIRAALAENLYHRIASDPTSASVR